MFGRTLENPPDRITSPAVKREQGLGSSLSITRRPRLKAIHQLLADLKIRPKRILLNSN
jgi:hypothetical protein